MAKITPNTNNQSYKTFTDEHSAHLHSIYHFNKTGEIRAFTPEGEMLPLQQKPTTK